MDDLARKIISFRRQQEAGWQPLPAGPEQKTRPAFADWAAAMGKQAWLGMCVVSARSGVGIGHRRALIKFLH